MRLITTADRICGADTLCSEVLAWVRLSQQPLYSTRGCTVVSHVRDVKNTHFLPAAIEESISIVI